MVILEVTIVKEFFPLENKFYFNEIVLIVSASNMAWKHCCYLLR